MLKDVEVVSRICWAGAPPTVFQLLVQGVSPLVLPGFLESDWHSRSEGFLAGDGSADRHFAG